MSTASRQTLGRFLGATARMRPTQIFGRVHRAVRPRSRPGHALRRAAQATAWAEGFSYRDPFLWGPGGDAGAEEIRCGVFRLVGKEVNLGEEDGRSGRAIRWDDRGQSVHWMRMLHSWEWLVHLSPAEGHALIRSYCATMASRLDHEGLHPWPTAFRIQSAIRWKAQHGADAELARQVAQWADLVSLNLEWRLLGNHLLKNAVALSLAGRALAGPRAAAWRDRGDRLLTRLVRTDILPDGGHEERSPMYHALVLQDLLDVLSVTRPGELVHEVVARAARPMATLLRGTIHPDGEVACFSDSGLGIAPRPEVLLKKAESLGCGPGLLQPGLRTYPYFGLLILEHGPWWIAIDAGPACPDHLPGHAHADSLAIEASVGRRRLFVDTGVSTYSELAVRHHERGTPAHNTVTVAGANSSDVYGLFRMGRRARVRAVRHAPDPVAPWVEAAHDGYTRLRGRPVHERQVDFKGPATLWVRDAVSGGHDQIWESRWHLAPGWAVEPAGWADENVWILIGPEGGRVRAECRGGRIAIEPARVCLRFGYPEQTVVLSARACSPAGPVEWRFTCE